MMFQSIDVFFYNLSITIKSDAYKKFDIKELNHFF